MAPHVLRVLLHQHRASMAAGGKLEARAPLLSHPGRPTKTNTTLPTIALTVLDRHFPADQCLTPYHTQHKPTAILVPGYILKSTQSKPNMNAKTAEQTAPVRTTSDDVRTRQNTDVTADLHQQLK